MKTNCHTDVDRWCLAAILVITCVYGFILGGILVHLFSALLGYDWWGVIRALGQVFVLLCVTIVILGPVLYAATRQDVHS